MRHDNRQTADLRPLTIERGYTKHAAGSVLISMGETKVICTATFEDSVPPFLRNSGTGWITAEYGMLPGATNTRNRREASKGKQTGRTTEIQRLIGRSLRQAIDLKSLGERSITIDCDVIQADGGTRTASITGGMVALKDCIDVMIKDGVISHNPLIEQITAISVGILKNTPLLDLNYIEDSAAEVDMNVVMNGTGKFIEVQGTAESAPFSRDELNALLELAEKGNKELQDQINKL